MGWRYLFFTCGALVFTLSMARVAVIKFHETPKFLLCRGMDEKVVETLQDMARKYNRPCELTLERLQSRGKIHSDYSERRNVWSELEIHVRGLFTTRAMTQSTVLVWLSWAVIGLGYALYYVYLPEYLASRNELAGETSQELVWRNYAITNLSAIPGPVLAAYLSERPCLGRKGTMCIGAFLTSERHD